MTGPALRHDDLKLHLRVLDGDHEISAKARVGATRMMELLPLARQICEGVSAIATRHEEAQGKAISCRTGCAACCRHLIPIAPAEAVRLAEVVETMPRERRRAVKKRFEKTLQRMEQLGLLDPGRPRGQTAMISTKTDPKEAWEDASVRYFEARVACPFLEDEACVVYAERPMICREYQVTTPADLCATLSPDVRDVPRPVRMSEVMTDATNALLGREDFSVPLAMALEWSASHRGALEAEGDGEEMAMALVRCIQGAS